MTSDTIGLGQLPARGTASREISKASGGVGKSELPSFGMEIDGVGTC